jgi:hypothetical protein
VRAFLYKRAPRLDVPPSAGIQRWQPDDSLAGDDVAVAAALREAAVELRLMCQLLQAEQQHDTELHQRDTEVHP